MNNENKIKLIIKDRLNGNSVNELTKKYNKSFYILKSILIENGIEVSKTKYTYNKNYFDDIDYTHKAYILGFAYADGNVCSRRLGNKTNCFGISINKKDIEILNFIKSEIAPNKPIKSGEKYCSLSITNVEICNGLIKHGCTPRKTFTIKYPQHINDKYFFDFLRGYFDGDGNLYIGERKRKNKGIKAIWSIISNVQFCKDIQKKLKSLINIDSHIYINSGKNQNIAELRVMKYEDIIILFNKLYENPKCYFLKRKYNKYIELIDRKKIIKKTKEKIKLKLKQENEIIYNKILGLKKLGIELKSIAKMLEITYGKLCKLLYKGF